MKKFTEQIKKGKAKGFTLVEVIVVMLIIAILAALLIPSLTGYIDKANNQAAIVEARNTLTAAQTTASEKYVTDRAASAVASYWSDTDLLDEIKALAEVDGTIANLVVTKGKVISFDYTTTGSIKVVYSNKTFVIDESET